MKILAFINNRQEIDRTSLVYHLAWMYEDFGLNVVAADLDPQAGLTGMFLPESELNALWNGTGSRRTVFGALGPLLDGCGDVRPPHVEEISPGIGLLAGDASLSAGAFADRGKDDASRIAAGLRRVLHLAAETNAATLILADMGPNANLLNRAGLTAADHVVVPLAPDLRSLESLRILGPALRRRQRDEPPNLRVPTPRPSGNPLAGYVVTRQLVRLYLPLGARWIDRMPDAYREAVAGGKAPPGTKVGEDPCCLGTLSPFQLLMPMAEEARKPMFFLKPADGAVGGHAPAVAECYREYRNLARKLAKRCEIPMP